LLIKEIAVVTSPVMANKDFVLIRDVKGVNGKFEIRDYFGEIFTPFVVNFTIGVREIDK
jgi:hypothetical protein